MTNISNKNRDANERFRAFLRKWIAESGKTQKDAITDLGIPTSSIKNFLSKTASLSLNKMEEIAQKINSDLVDMLADGRAILEGREPLPCLAEAENNLAGQDKNELNLLKQLVETQKALLEAKDEEIKRLRIELQSEADPMANFALLGEAARITPPRER